MNPGPGLPILRRGHLLDLHHLFQPRQVRLETATRAHATNLIEVLIVDALPVGWDLKILGQPFVEPKRHIAEYAVQQSMGQLVPEILLNAVAPVSVDEQVFRAPDASRLSHEKSAALGKIRITSPHEVFVLVSILENINLDGRVG